MKLLDLFAGIGGFSLAAHWMGWKTVAFCEQNKFCQQVLRKNFGEGITIHDDIRELDGRQYRGSVDVVCGGFPCQPASIAGKRQGKSDDRYLFPEMLRVVDESRPRWVVAENVRGLLSVGNGELFEEVCSLLDGIEYSVQTFCIPASAVNAPHRRDRLWIIAHSNSNGKMGKGRYGSSNHIERNASTQIQKWQNEQPGAEFADRPLSAYADDKRRVGREKQSQGGEWAIREGRGNNRSLREPAERGWDEPWPEAATRLCTLDDGLPGGLVRPKGWRVNALKAAGNAIVPQIAFEIFKAIEAADGE